jgi:hypothetical protein
MATPSRIATNQDLAVKTDAIRTSSWRPVAWAVACGLDRGPRVGFMGRRLKVVVRPRISMTRCGDHDTECCSRSSLRGVPAQPLSTRQTGPMHVGELWAYRARPTDPLVRVVVMRIGVRELARVLVRFVDDAFEGRQEWVPPARLKGLWTDVADLEAAEQHWEHIWERGIGLGDPRWEAAHEIMRLLVNEDLAELGYREGGATRIHQVDQLARALTVRADLFTGTPDAFFEDGDLVVPWEVTELIVTTAARKDPDPVMAYIELEEAQAFHDSIPGGRVSGRRGAETYVEGDDCSKIDLLRTWCSSEARASTR